jgi:hypothetical protein
VFVLLGAAAFFSVSSFSKFSRRISLVCRHNYFHNGPSFFGCFQNWIFRSSIPVKCWRYR